jgi:hypothetical protein
VHVPCWKPRGADFTALHVRKHRLQGVEYDLDLAADQIGDGGRTSFIGDVLDIDAGGRPEHLGSQMAWSADAGTSIIQPARILLCERHKLSDIFDRLRRMHRDRDRRQRDQRERSEVLDRVIWQLGVERRVDGVRAHGADQQRLTVGRGFRYDVGTDRATSATPIVDDDSRLQRFPQHLRKRSRDDVGGAAGRERHDDADLFAGEHLGASGRNPHRKVGAS